MPAANSKKIALLGMLLAVNLIALYAASFIESNTLIFNLIGAVTIAIAVVETDLKKGMVFYVASFLLGFILIPNKVNIVTYLALFGPYALFKEPIEAYFYKRPNKALELIIKLITMDILALIAYILMRNFITIPLNIWLILLSQVLFIVYDYVFGWCIHLYITQIKSRLR